MALKLASGVFTKNYIKIFKPYLPMCRNVTHLSKLSIVSPSVKEVYRDFTRQKGTTSTNRLIRQEPSSVCLGFIPEEWFKFFFSKTGVTGLGTFTFTFSIFLISKEYYVMEHEYYNGLSMAVVCILGTKYIGPSIAKYLDKEVDNYENRWTEIRNNNKKTLEESVETEKENQWRSEGQLMLVAVKRENVALQLEAAYRKRLMYAYIETKRRLQYCTECAEVEKAIVRRHMASWVVAEVSKAVSEKIEKESLNKCFEDLQVLAKSFEGLKTGYPPIKPDDDP